MPCEAPLVEVLASLDTYNASHTKASSNFKSAMWNLSKARRQKGGLGVGFSYNASDVREELRAHAFLEKSPEPSLTEEDANGDDDLAKSCSGENGPFVLRFRGRDLKRITQNDNLPTNSSSDTGLRQRKGKYTDCKKIEWSEETYQDKEEEKLRKTDPIGEY